MSSKITLTDNTSTPRDFTGEDAKNLGGGVSAKAWANFNGTGTVAIRDSFNVVSITDNGTGIYTINLTNTMPDINYPIIGTAQQEVGSDSVGMVNSTISAGQYLKTTASFRIHSVDNGTNTVDDAEVINVVIF